MDFCKSNVMQKKLQKRKNRECSISVVDLFCGAGGLTRGLMDEGLNVTAGVDIDEACKFPYEYNNSSASFLKLDVADVSGDTLAELYPNGDLRVLVGCAPCQPFSKYTQGLDAKSDEKWSLLSSFARLVDEVRPEVVSMENVPELQRHSIFKRFVRALETLEYHVSYSVVFCPDYGVPQNRNRLVLLASKRGKIEIIKPTHKPAKYLTVKSAIGHLSSLRAGKNDPTDPLHRSSRLSPLNMKRMRASKPGGTWRDWSPSLVAACHKKKKGRSYPGVYARMEWDSPSPTITTQFYGFGNGRFGHPKQNRGISLREGAILQSFPESYAFVEPDGTYPMKAIGRLIGNAVPVRLGQAIGKSILKHVESYYER
jgi:DNA (cytosine-5)-methyltransferase 1